MTMTHFLETTATPTGGADPIITIVMLVVMVAVFG